MTTSSRPADLPDYDRPPVTEVVLSMQFAANPQFRTVHAGLFWNLIRDRFPKASEQPPLQPGFETFGGAPILPQAMQIQSFFTPPFPRFWFESLDGAQLLQLQHDRILYNWRMLGDTVYPRYEFVRACFATEVERLVAFFKAENLGEIRPNQCELTYINTITLEEENNPHTKLDEITPLWSDHARQIDGLSIESTAVQTRFILTNEGEPYGRLHVSFTPSFRTTNFKPVIQLEMTARGRPDRETLDSAFQLLDRERCAIVRTFTEVTKEKMHKKWGRNDVPRS